MGRLIVTVIIFGPPGHARAPFDKVCGEVEPLKLDILMHMVRLHLVHCWHMLEDLTKDLPHLLRLDEPKTLLRRPRLLARQREWHHRFPKLHGTKTRIAGEDVDEMGRAGSRQAGNDDRPIDFHIQYVRMLLHEMFELQTVDGIAHHLVERGRATKRPQPSILIHRPQPDL